MKKKQDTDVTSFLSVESGSATKSSPEVEAVKDLLKLTHDLNNLLVGIKGNARLLDEEGAVSGQGRRLIQKLLACADRAARLTGEMQSKYADGDRTLTESAAMRGHSGSALEAVTSAEVVVLVIDDEEIVRSVTREILSRSGYTVLVAESGEEGLALYDRHAMQIDCILLDLTMPFMSGNLVYARLKAANPDVNVVLMSGYTDQQTLEQFEGISAFLPKPFGPEQLLETIAEACEREGIAVLASGIH